MSAIPLNASFNEGTIIHGRGVAHSLKGNADVGDVTFGYKADRAVSHTFVGELLSAENMTFKR